MCKQNDPACARFAHFKKYRNNNAPSTKSVYNCTQKHDFLIRCLHFLLKTKNQSTCKTTEVPNANNSNENRNKTRRDHDITMAGSYNNREVAKLPTWYDRGDC